MPVLEQITDAQDRFFANVEATNDRVVDTVTATVDAISTRMPEITSRIPEVPFSDRIPTPDLGFVKQLPQPLEVVDAYFDFVTRGVEMNRSFAEKMVGAVGGTTKTAPKPAAKKTTAKKTAAKKPAAKKTTAKASANKTAAKKPAAKKTSKK